MLFRRILAGLFILCVIVITLGVIIRKKNDVSPQTKKIDYIKSTHDKRSDSANQNTSFDPYGYYLPAKEIIDKKQRLEWIFISTHADHTIQSVELRITDINNDKWTTMECTDYAITKDSLSIHYSDKKFGDIRVSGTFRNTTHANEKGFDGKAKMNDAIYNVISPGQKEINVWQRGINSTIINLRGCSFHDSFEKLTY